MKINTTEICIKVREYDELTISSITYEKDNTTYVQYNNGGAYLEPYEQYNYNQDNGKRDITIKGYVTIPQIVEHLQKLYNKGDRDNEMS